MGTAILAILVKSIPYILPFVLGGLGWLAKKAWSAIIGKVNNEKVAIALETLGAKAGTVVESLEQTIRPALAAATADGKLTADEAKAIAKLALEQLFSVGAPEIATLKAEGMESEAVEKLAGAMLEQAVFRLPVAPKSNVMGYSAKVDALRPPEWQQMGLYPPKVTP